MQRGGNIACKNGEPHIGTSLAKPRWFSLTFGRRKMTTRTKLNLASFASYLMAFLSVFSRPLGISNGFQWTLLIGMFVPLGLIFHYNKKLKEERTDDTVRARLQASEVPATRKKIRKRLILIWVCTVGYSLAAPIWLPITGVSLGARGDFLIGVATAIMVSAIFAFRLKKMPNQTPQPTPSTGG